MQYRGQTYNLQDTINAVNTDCQNGRLGDFLIGELKNNPDNAGNPSLIDAFA